MDPADIADSEKVTNYVASVAQQVPEVTGESPAYDPVLMAEFLRARLGDFNARLLTPESRNRLERLLADDAAAIRTLAMRIPDHSEDGLIDGIVALEENDPNLFVKFGTMPAAMAATAVIRKADENRAPSGGKRKKTKRSRKTKRRHSKTSRRHRRL